MVPMDRTPAGDRDRGRVRELLWGLVERHGEDYVREGVRLLKFLQVAAVLVGAAALVAGVALAVWLWP